jgi:WD40 repeat protein
VLLVDSIGKYPKDLIDEDFAKPLTLTEPTFDKGKMVEGRSGVDQAVEKLFKDPKNNRADQLESNNSDPKHPRPNVLPGVMSVQFSPDGAWLAIATGSWRSGADLPTGGVGKVYLWSVSDPSRIFAAPTQHKLTIDAVTFNPHPAGPAKIEFATAGSDGDAEFFQIPPGGGTPQEERSGKRTYKRTASISAGKGMNAAAFSPNGRYYAMVFGDGHMAVKDMLAPDTAKIKIPLLDASGLMSVAFYDDNKILVGTRDGQILEVDRATLQPYKVADSGQGLVSSLTVSTDRKILISTGSNATVQVWRLQDHHQQVRQLQDHGHLEAWDGNLLLGHRLEAYSAAISPHNELIVSGSADKSVRFWDMQEKMDCRSEKTEDCYPVYASRPSTYLDAGAVAGVAFSPDGRQLAQIRGVAAKNGATGHATPGRILRPGDTAMDVFAGAERRWYCARLLEGREVCGYGLRGQRPQRGPLECEAGRPCAGLCAILATHPPTTPSRAPSLRWRSPRTESLPDLAPPKTLPPPYPRQARSFSGGRQPMEDFPIGSLR